MAVAILLGLWDSMDGRTAAWMPRRYLPWAGSGDVEEVLNKDDFEAGSGLSPAEGGQVSGEPGRKCIRTMSSGRTAFPPWESMWPPFAFASQVMMAFSPACGKADLAVGTC